ncbi:lytic murein transglycosylase [Phenylobacterium sp.]|uniref:lytic murein transglycosylase n=1 Tax=Phenylobacterium sp. TaxID=1871053 RepID=UPI0025D3BCE0|nr:lytic murein transglycosylase [Phenylobacterium sp.]MBX3482086.1 lytic murein transglycosylase [Phenylobacterium sp.]
MSFRLPLMLLLAGCASPMAPGGSTPMAGVGASVGEAAPAQASIQPPTASGDQTFDAWASDFESRAMAAGIEPAVFRREMAGLTPDPRVAGADSRQPEFSKPIGDYLRGVVTADRVAIGQRYHASMPVWGAIEQRYGVPRDILLGVWALESGFGSIQGDYDTLRSLATLAAQGRRRGWAEGEIVALLKIIQSGEQPRARLRGSWAGAMGQTQFIPSTFLATAVDQDGDGRRDIWGSSADSLASAANLLAKAGWARGQSWAREVSVPARFDYSVTEGPKLTPAEWAAQGVKPADGRPWADADTNARAQLAAPAGAGGPIFLLFPNHFALRQYNNSLSYALGVGLLADRFAGAPPLTRAWPQETPLSLVDRMTAQRALNALGFDAGQPDGVVGMGTRKALRSWQKARGFTADGYLSGDMVQRLKTEAAAAKPPPAT